MKTLNLTFSLIAILAISACGKSGGGGKKGAAPATPGVVAPTATTPAACGNPTNLILDGESLPFSSLKKVAGGYAGIYESGYSLRSVTVIQNVKNASGQSMGSTTYNFDLRDSRRYLIDKNWQGGGFQVFVGGGNDINLQNWCPSFAMPSSEYSIGLKHQITVPAAFYKMGSQVLVRDANSFSQLFSVTLYGDMGRFQPVYPTDAMMKATTVDQVLGHNRGSKYVLQFGSEKNPSTVVLQILNSNEARTSGATQMWVDTYTYALYSAN